MKLFGFNLSRENSVKVEEVQGYKTFSTPFLKVGKGNLSTPYIDARVLVNGYVRFGSDNLFPQLINQLYYTSPLHASIVDFKTNATIGGGFEVMKPKSITAIEEVDILTFIKRLDLKVVMPQMTKDIILHNRCYFKITFNQTKDVIKVEFVGAEKVRKDKYGENYSICYDWSTLIDVENIKPYKHDCQDRTQLYIYEAKCVGQDVYPLPSYTSAFNWAFLDGEMSYLQKSNIVNSIFPSFAMMFPKKPQTPEEMQGIKDTIEKGKGASEAGKALAFFANNKDQLPTIEAIPTSNNDNLFQVTTESIDSKICQAHIIDPILMGIRVSGKLGSGTDIKQAYTIFEKNDVMPRRSLVEDIINDLFDIAKLPCSIKLNNFQVINETIIEVEDSTKKINDALNAMSPLVATKVLESMTENEIRALASLPPVDGGDKIKSQTTTPAP